MKPAEGPARLLTTTQMETFYQLFGYVAALCAGIMILTVFFKILGALSHSRRGLEIVKMKGFVREGKLVHIHLSGGKSLLGVRFVGFTERNSIKAGFPFELSNMVVLENTNGTRVFIRADSVKMIEEVEAAAQ